MILIAFWPVWGWYVQRTFDRSDEPLGLLALASLIALLWLRPDGSTSRSDARPLLSGATNYVLVAFVLIVYAICFSFLPKIVSAAVAVLTTSLLVSKVLRLCRFLPGDWFLALLSLPIVASLNFFVGYPLRILVTIVACLLLRISGFAVDANNAELIFAGQAIEVDAPCSGIKMLWFSFYLAAALASYYQLPVRAVACLLPLALASALLGNIIRVTSLFYVEAGIISAARFGADPHFVHEATGVAAFLFQGILIFALAQFLSAKPAQEALPAAPLAGSSGVETPGGPLNEASGNTTISFMVFVAMCALSACLPFFVGNANNNANQAASNFPGWPKSILGLELKPLPESPKDQVFLQGFPGKAARFQSGAAQVVLRWVNHESRQVHPSSDCYKGIGYEISWLPVLIDQKGNRWRHFSAKKDSEELEIKELIFDEHAHTWSDVSSWYWDAATTKTQAPWWVITIIEPRNPAKK